MATDINIEQLANLAHLAIDEPQSQALSTEINHIFTMIDTLTQQKTDDIEPLAHPLNLHQPLRSDQVSETNQRETLQQNAPQTNDGLYLVPPFITTE